MIIMEINEIKILIIITSIQIIERLIKWLTENSSCLVSFVNIDFGSVIEQSPIFIRRLLIKTKLQRAEREKKRIQQIDTESSGSKVPRGKFIITDRSMNL